MAIKLENKTRVEAPDVDYPFGNIKDSTPTVKGTPVNVEVYGDFHQYFAKLLEESGITANDLPDNFTNGFQYFQALINTMNSAVGKAIILSLIGPYTADDVVVLYGCEVVDNIPGVSTITDGAIYYNGRIYYVPEDLAIASPADTLVYKIDTTIQPEFIYLANDTTGSGIADFDAVTVKYVNLLPEHKNEVVLSITPNPAGTYTTDNVYAVKRGGMVYISGTLKFIPTALVAAGSAMTFDISLPAKYHYDRTLYNIGGDDATWGTAVINKANSGADNVFAVGRVKIGASDNEIKIVLGTTLLLLAGQECEISFGAAYLAKNII